MARAYTPPQRGHGLGVHTDPGSNSWSHGATSAHIGAQVDIRPLEVHHASSIPGKAIQLPCSRVNSRLADLDRAPRISTRAADLPRSQLTTMPRLNNTFATMAHTHTHTNYGRCNVNVPTEDATEARVIGLSEVRRHRVVHWVGIGHTPNITNSQWKTQQGQQGAPKGNPHHSLPKHT